MEWNKFRITSVAFIILLVILLTDDICFSKDRSEFFNGADNKSTSGKKEGTILPRGKIPSETLSPGKLTPEKTEEKPLWERMTASCKSGMMTGCIAGGLTGGFPGSISSGAVFGITGPTVLFLTEMGVLGIKNNK